MDKKINPAVGYCERLSHTCIEASEVDRSLYAKYGVKRGLRDLSGNGVVTGLTNISYIKSKDVVDGQDVPCDGVLLYRGYNIYDLVRDYSESGRFGFEETAYLLLFGTLPNADQLAEFKSVLSKSRSLPTNFMRDVIMKAPSGDIMNSLTKSILTLASYDKNASDISIPNVLRQCIMLISLFPVLSVYGYNAYNHYKCNKSLYIHRPNPKLSTAENLLRLLRADKKYSEIEAKVLDIALILHMEHGGGNNSTFTTRVVTSSGSDTYSVIAAALSSLKGPRHGGANIKVVEMMKDIKNNIRNIDDDEEIKEYLSKLLDGEAGDGSGLIYGMGHAVYSKSDPRATIFKSYVKQLADDKKRYGDYALYSAVERLAPQVIAQKRHIYKGVSANVDFYSGFVYSMLDIPPELYTAIFATARIVGWSAHRIEELVSKEKIIRPAYQSLVSELEYKTLDER